MAKFIYLLLLITASLFIEAQVNPNNHYVNPYHRKDGTYVPGHFRTNPNNTNRDNYSTRGNTNPYTGKPGWITPDNNTFNINSYNYNNYNNNQNYSNSGNYNYGNSSYYSNVGENKIGFWTDFGMGGNISIYIDDRYAGTINNYFNSGEPNCNTYGTVALNFENRIYNVKAIDSYGYYWHFNLNPSYTKCNGLRLQYSKSNRIRIGKTYAYYMYEPRKYSFWVPFIATAIFPPVGIASIAGINIINPKKNISSDKYFNKGYRRRVNWAFFKKSMLGFGLGLVGYAIISEIRD